MCFLAYTHQYALLTQERLPVDILLEPAVIFRLSEGLDFHPVIKSQYLKFPVYGSDSDNSPDQQLLLLKAIHLNDSIPQCIDQLLLKIKALGPGIKTITFYSTGRASEYLS